jgi:NADH-quinone oxidoreductase subunit E
LKYQAKADVAYHRWAAAIPFVSKLLTLREVGEKKNAYASWLPVPVVDMSHALPRRLYADYEVATFYDVISHLLALPRAGLWDEYFVHVARVGNIIAACKNRGLVKGTWQIAMFTSLNEIRYMSELLSAPMVRINDDNYEDLDYDSMTTAILGDTCG